MVRVFVVIFFLSGLLGCSSIKVAEDASAEDIFAEAVRLEKKGYYDEALELFAKVRDQYPYLDYSVRAKLEMANIHFKRKDYELAQVFYKLFRDLHPHRQPDYVMYRLALSYYHTLPRAIDRDISLARIAEEHFQKFLSEYPESQYAEDGRAKLHEVQDKLMQQEAYIARFYFVRKMYKSAFLRYSHIIQNASRLWPEALLKGGISAAKIGEESKSQEYLRMLKQKFPDFKEDREIQKVINKYGLQAK